MLDLDHTMRGTIFAVSRVVASEPSVSGLVSECTLKLPDEGRLLPNPPS